MQNIAAHLWILVPIAIALGMILGCLLAMWKPSVVEKFFRDVTTEKDGESFDVKRILWIVGVFSYLLFSGYGVIANKMEFDMEHFGAGLALVLAAGGLNQMIGSKSEAPISGANT